MIDRTPEWFIDQDFDYLVFSQGIFARFFADPEKYGEQVTAYDNLFNRFQLVKLFEDGNYEVRVYKVK